MGSNRDIVTSNISGKYLGYQLSKSFKEVQLPNILFSIINKEKSNV